jgi:hypothetical protein
MWNNLNCTVCTLHLYVNCYGNSVSHVVQYFAFSRTKLEKKISLSMCSILFRVVFAFSRYTIKALDEQRNSVKFTYDSTIKINIFHGMNISLITQQSYIPLVSREIFSIYRHPKGYSNKKDIFEGSINPLISITTTVD